MGMEAIIASPPQLVVTRAARKVVLARSREPPALFRMYRAGSGKLQPMPAATVQYSPQPNIRPGPPSRPMIMPYVVVPAIPVRDSPAQTQALYREPPRR